MLVIFQCFFYSGIELAGYAGVVLYQKEQNLPQVSILGDSRCQLGQRVDLSNNRLEILIQRPKLPVFLAEHNPVFMYYVDD